MTSRRAPPAPPIPPIPKNVEESSQNEPPKPRLAPPKPLPKVAPPSPSRPVSFPPRPTRAAPIPSSSTPPIPSPTASSTPTPTQAPAADSPAEEAPAAKVPPAIPKVPPKVNRPIPAIPAPKKEETNGETNESEPPKIEPPKPGPRAAPPIPAPVPKPVESAETPEPRASPPLPAKSIGRPSTIAPPAAKKEEPVETSPPPAQKSPMARSSVVAPATSSSPALSRPMSSSVGLGVSPEGKYASTTLLEMPDLKSLSAFDVAKAFIRSEEAYLKMGLQCVVVEFEFRFNAHIKLGRPIITQEEVHSLFLNIDNIYDFNKQLYTALEQLELGGEEKVLGGLGSTMQTFIPFFKLYQKYVENREHANLFNDWMKNRDRFRYEVELNELCSGQKLRTLLSAPVTRLAQYLIFLGSVHEKLPPTSPGYQPLEEAIRSIQVVTDNIAQKLKDGKARNLCVKVQTEVFKGANLDLLSPTRFVCKWGDLKLLSDKLFGKGRGLKRHTFVIFNDCFLYGVRAGKLQAGKPKGVCRLEGLTVNEVPDDAKLGITFGFEFKHPHIGALTVCAASAEDRSKWMQAAEKAVSDLQLAKQSSGLQASQQTISDEEFEQLITKKKMKHTTTTSSSASRPGGPSLPGRPASPAPGAPPAASKNGNWRKLFDASSGYYYYENDAGDSSWDPPPGWVEPSGSEDGGSSSIPDAPAPDAPEAPPMDVPDAPDPDAPPAPEMTTDDAPPSTGGASSGASGGSSSGGSSSGGGGADLLSSIRAAGGVGGLRPAKSAPPRAAPAPKGPPPKADLQATLQTSLANYRQFVQADDDDDGGGDDEDPDWE